MRVRLHFFLLACIFGAPAVPASAQIFFPGSPGPYERYYEESRALSPRDVVRSLYRRYGMSRVLDVRGYGDVYQATAIDRRGLTVLLTVDAYSGDIIERRVARLEGEPPLRPPQPIPGARSPAPWNDEVQPARPVAPYDLGTGRQPEKAERKPPRRSQQARKPDAATPTPDQPPPASDTLTVPRPTPVTPAPLPDLPKGPDTAARPPVEEKTTEPPAAAPVSPPPPAVAKPAQPEPEKPQRQASPAQRLPEPLIDPKTGKPNPAASDAPPVTPLDDTGKPARKIEIVPPAGFD
jgi:hypothetical protein